MNKRYMDFVPAKKEGEANVRVARSGVAVKSRTATSSKVVAKPRAAAKPRTSVSPRVVTRVASPRSVTTPMERKAPVMKGGANTKAPTLGVVEDLTAHFVRTDVPKRPLNEKPSNSVKAAKAKKVKMPGIRSSKAKAAERQAKAEAEAAKVAERKVAEKKATSKTYKTPKSPFINQNKVVKRPLSGNVYRKEVVAPKEEPKGPVTIIAKPEKEKHIGVVITIILTIILGAAAGTVAFLLLPK